MEFTAVYVTVKCNQLMSGSSRNKCILGTKRVQSTMTPSLSKQETAENAQR